MKNKKLIKSIFIFLFLLILVDRVCAIADSNLSNNNGLKYVNVSETKDLNITFKAVNQQKSIASSVKEYISVINVTYPVADDKFYSDIGQPLNSSLPPWLMLLRVVKEGILSRSINVGVGVLPTGWFKSNGYKGLGLGAIFVPGVLVEEHPDYNYIPAHEIGHFLGLCDEYNSTDWDDEDTPLFRCPNGDKNDDDQLDPECLPRGCPAQTLGLVVPWVASNDNVILRNIMGNNVSDNVWINDDSYKQLLRLFKVQTTAPKTLMISGFVNKSSDSMTLFDAYELERRFLFIPNGTISSNYSVQLIDSNNATISTLYFDIPFIDLYFNGTPEPTNIGYFLFVVNNTQNISKINLLNKGIINDTLIRTNNRPIVTISYPLGTEEIFSPFNITWNASDADNDALYYAILVSSDNGGSYVTLNVDYNQTFYEINPDDFTYSEQYLFKVLATDGINTNSDVSNTFTMGIHPPAADIHVRTTTDTYYDNEMVNLRFNETSSELFTLTIFSNLNSTENLTFSESQSITRYLRLPKYANVTRATLNISGYGLQK